MYVCTLPSDFISNKKNLVLGDRKISSSVGYRQTVGFNHKEKKIRFEDTNKINKAQILVFFHTCFTVSHYKGFVSYRPCFLGKLPVDLLLLVQGQLSSIIP